MKGSRSWLAVAATVAVAIAVMVPMAVVVRPQQTGEQVQKLAVLGASRALLAEIEGHVGALQTAAVRLRALETLPDEIIDRALSETATVYPSFVRVVAGGAGGALRAARPAGPDGRPELPVDPSPGRRQAMASALAAQGAAGAAPWIGAGPGQIEIGVVVRPQVEGEPGLYLGGDIAGERIEALLGGLERRTGVALGLEGPGPAVLYPRGRALPAGAWRSELGAGGLVLHVAVGREGGTRPRPGWVPYGLAGGLGGLAIGVVLVAVGRAGRRARA